MHERVRAQVAPCRGQQPHFSTNAQLAGSGAMMVGSTGARAGVIAVPGKRNYCSLNEDRNWSVCSGTMAFAGPMTTTW